MKYETVMILAQEVAEKVYERELAKEDSAQFREIGVTPLTAGIIKIADGLGFKKPDGSIPLWHDWRRMIIERAGFRGSS
jgi:hypothetical protein